MKGILWAYLRATDPSTPRVEATALHSASWASFTMFSESKYRGLGANEGRSRVFDALVHGQYGKIARAAQPSRADQGLKGPKHRSGPVRGSVDAVHDVGSGQVQETFVDG